MTGILRLPMAAIMAIAAHGAAIPGPSRFYAVSVSFSDFGPSFYYRILDVTQDGPDTLVRYVRIAPTNVYCPRMIVQAVEARVRNASPAKLVGKNHPCAVTPGGLHASLERYRRLENVFESVSFAIVAQCGGASHSLALPMEQQVDLRRLGKVHPEIAHLWTLVFEITNRVFGEKSNFHDRSQQEEAALQRAGEKLVPELISGRYDAGLVAALKGNVGDWESPSFRSLLGDYRGPISAKEVIYVPRLLDAEAYHFSEFVPPSYPVLAMMARIQGKVDIQMSVQPATGEVTSVTAIAGHPTLKPSAVVAAEKWRFVPNSVPAGTLTLTLEYSLRCP